MTSVKSADVKTTREYWWDVSAVAAAPDGYPRQIYAVNGQFPGPLIEANEGDEIVVHVTNKIDIGMTIHWHGIYQNGTQFMDGVPGVSQVRWEALVELELTRSALLDLESRSRIVSRSIISMDHTGGTPISETPWRMGSSERGSK